MSKDSLSPGEMRLTLDCLEHLLSWDTTEIEIHPTRHEDLCISVPTGALNGLTEQNRKMLEGMGWVIQQTDGWRDRLSFK